MSIDGLKALERNRFFYGKLLTAEDFTAEQSYFITKQRMLNSLVFGSGVIAGMSVIKADENQVVINSGVALDSAGREIIIPEPVTVRINKLNGYDEFARQNTDYVRAFLCVEYNEDHTQPTHSISASAVDDENNGPENNRITEGFSLYITAEPPAENPCDAENIALIRKTVISDVIKVSVICPSVVRAGEEFVLETIVEKGNLNDEIALQFDLSLESFSASDIHVSYKSKTAELESETVRTRLKASLSFAKNGTLKIENVKAVCNGAQLPADAVVLELEIADDSGFAVTNELRGRCKTLPHALYLATLQLYISPNYYILESVKSLPFSQNVPSISELRAFQLRSEFAEKITSQKNDSSFTQPPPQTLTNSGYISVEIPDKSKKAQIFRSTEIPHGLGTGDVFITAGISSGSEFVFESAPVLNEDFSYGVQVDKESGLFSVAVKINRDFDKATLNFCWLATRLPEKSVCRKLEIYPSVRYVGQYETTQFTVSHPDGEIWRTGELQWDVTPEDGGVITQTGLFTAHDKAGLYEICVKCVAEPELTATAFLVVRK